MQWVRHILRKEDRFLERLSGEAGSRKMVMRMQKPYGEGSILMDAPQHARTMDELAELARDMEEWQGTVNAIYPAKRLTTAVFEIGSPREIEKPSRRRAAK